MAEFDPFSAGMGLLDTVINNWQANERQSDAQNFSAEQFAKRYQVTTADMKAAGLNPMLAASLGGGNAPTSSAASAAGSNIAGSYNQGKIASAQSELLWAQADKAKTEAAVARATLMERTQAELNQIYADTGVKLETQGQISMLIDKGYQEIENLKTEQLRTNAVIKNLDQQNKLLEQQGYSEVVRQAMMRASASLYTRQATMLGLDIDAARISGNFGRISKEYIPAVKAGTDAVKSLNPVEWFKGFSKGK